MELLRNPSLATVAPPGQRVLLIAGPAVDVRLPWARWHQPVGLLQIGAALRKEECDVRLIDCLELPANGRLARERVASLEIQGARIDLWRFGLPPSKVMARLQAWEREGWRPERILVSCSVSTWWQGARDLIISLKRVVQAPVYLGGPYPSFYPEHAAAHTASDALVIGGVMGAEHAVPDLTLYGSGSLPHFAGIQLLRPSSPSATGGQPREPGEIAEEVASKISLGVTTFALFDEWLGPEQRGPLSDALKAITSLSLEGVRFVTIGNTSPRLIDEGIARLLRQARFQQVHLHDDLEPTVDGVRQLSGEDDYARCARAFHRAGFRPRSDDLCASVVVGFPGDDLRLTTERLVRLASIVGSINLVPFQYTPGTPEGRIFDHWLAQRNGHLDPTMLSAQLYPLARLAGATLEDYRELTRLAALLNSKYRNQTFDFLSRGLTASLLRASLGKGWWNPFTSSAGCEGRAAVASERAR